MEKDLTFSAALVRLIDGDEIRRAGESEHLALIEGTIYFVEPNGEKVEWRPTQLALLADNWEVSKERE